MATGEGRRRENEGKFETWKDLPDGGRRYSLSVPGRLGWKAIYLKEVDANESTIHFWQEIYDDAGNLVEEHHKFPRDLGHKKIGS